MSSEIALKYFLPAVAFAMGACIGSFLNVVIYRLPLGMRVDRPKRSFCPNCKRQIPAWLNIPLFTWLMLRGKCKWCGSEIKFRYFLVELLTAICFLAIWKLYLVDVGLIGVAALWVFAALLIGATFIDLDHMIIPDSISLGGIGAGILFSLIVPELQRTSGWMGGLRESLIGAACGYGILWGVVRLGKLLFGQIRHDFEEPVDLEISQPDEDEEIVIRFGPEIHYEWGEVFYRDSDRLEMEVTALQFNDSPVEVKESFTTYQDRFVVDGEVTDLEEVKKVTGKCVRAVVPREAMGFGDVKFLAMIGAFQGWHAVLLTLMAGCIIGAVVGTVQKFLSQESKLPFGPYLALGAFIWIFAGTEIWNWYSGWWSGGFR